MRPLPKLYQGALALALAAVLGASSAQAAVSSSYITTINTILGSEMQTGKTVDTCSASQLQTATMRAISRDSANAGYYVHDVLASRPDRNSIAVNLATGALVSGSAVVNADATLAGTIAGMATATDLQSPAISNSPLLQSTIEKLATAVVKKMPSAAINQTAFNVGNLVSQNLTLATQLDRAQFARNVIGTLPNITVQGRFAGGVSMNFTAWASLIQALNAKVPKAAGEICYSVVALSGSLSADRIAASVTTAQNVSTGVSPTQKGLIAQGFVKATGTAQTAAIINNVLATDRGISGKEVLYANLSAFTNAVAGATAKDLPMDQAEAVMRIITKTIASSASFRTSISATSNVVLTGVDRANIAAAAVKAAPVSLAGADKTINPPNPANAAVQGVLDSGAIGDPYAFAVTAAKGAANYENAGQVANAVANYITNSNSLAVSGTAPAAYVAISSAVIKALPKAAAAISQRVAQLIPPDAAGMNQAARVDLAVQLSKTYGAQASLIATGVSNTDPQYADAVTAAVLQIPGNAGNAIRNNAAKIAGAVANSIPGEYACEVSQATGALIASGTLKLSQAAAIAKSIAQASSVKNSQEELQVVSAQMIDQLLFLFTPNNPTDPAKIAQNKNVVNAIAAVAKSVAQAAFAANSTKNNPTGNVDQNKRFVDYIAGSSAQIVVNNIGHSLVPADINNIVTAIQNAVLAVTTTTAGDNAVKSAIATAVANPNNNNSYATLCEKLNSEETPVTNY